jgi:carbon-monoxide dehydrogenase medium subunit
MYPANFDYHRASNVHEAAALLKKNPNAKLVSGGHSLLPAMKLHLAQPALLIDVSRISEMHGIKVADGTLTIGAATTHAQVAASTDVQKHCGLLSEAASLIGDPQVRNRGTIGGSLAHADPAADYPVAVSALGGHVTVIGADAIRTIPISSLFVDLFTTSLKADEVITSVSVPTYGKGTGGAYHKIAHPASGYSVAGAAALVSVSGGVCSSVSLYVGGATKNPVRCVDAENALKGKAPSADNVAAAAALVAKAIQDPMGDHYASGEYRVHLASVAAKRALMTAISRA